jgi:predicted methyltransferase
MDLTPVSMNVLSVPPAQEVQNLTHSMTAIHPEATLERPSELKRRLAQLAQLHQGQSVQKIYQLQILSRIVKRCQDIFAAQSGSLWHAQVPSNRFVSRVPITVGIVHRIMLKRVKHSLLSSPHVVSVKPPRLPAL